MIWGDKIIGVAYSGNWALLHLKDQESFCWVVRVLTQRADTGTPVLPRVGDRVWCRGQTAYWTSAGKKSWDDLRGCGSNWDIALKKVGHTLRGGYVG